jgi:Uncharacterized protein conserved in bacteria (DUF2272)
MNGIAVAIFRVSSILATFVVRIFFKRSHTMSQFTDKVVEVCASERALFKNEQAKEWWDPQFKRIGDYWRELGITRDGRTSIVFRKKPNGQLELDANGQPIPVHPNNNGNPPWSAAFISFVAKQAGAGTKFHYKGYHSHYIIKALKAAASAGSTAPWIARRVESYKPKVGDLVAGGREWAKNASFDTAETIVDTSVASDFFPSHTDFVVEVSTAKIVTVGGNVAQTVKRKSWPLNPNGTLNLAASASPSSALICVMECRI